jgi:putative transcriptional regulator
MYIYFFGGQNKVIKINISELLGKHKMSKTKLSNLTGIRLSTISDLYYEKTKMISMTNLNKLCKAFKCDVGEILTYISDDE